MPSEDVRVPITVTLKAMMAAYVPLTALLAVKPVGSGKGIYDDGAVPQAAITNAQYMPYLTIGAGVPIPDNTFGPPSGPKWGWNCTIQIKAVGTFIESAGQMILTKVIASPSGEDPGLFYHGRQLSVTGYGTAFCEEALPQPSLQTSGAIGIVREIPLILRVRVHDS